MLARRAWDTDEFRDTAVDCSLMRVIDQSRDVQLVREVGGISGADARHSAPALTASAARNTCVRLRRRSIAPNGRPIRSGRRRLPRSWGF